MKTLYLDIFSGISGDMLIGALIDLGVDFHRLESELGKLSLHDFHLHMRRAQKAGIEGIKFDVHLAHGHSHEHTHAGGVAHAQPHAHGHDEHHNPHDHQHAHEHDDAHEHEHHHSHEAEHVHARNYAEIKALISRSGLSRWVQDKSVAVFYRIAVAEGKIHGLPP